MIVERPCEDDHGNLNNIGVPSRMVSAVVPSIGFWWGLYHVGSKGLGGRSGDLGGNDVSNLK